jgi:hypothetical protein
MPLELKDQVVGDVTAYTSTQKLFQTPFFGAAAYIARTAVIELLDDEETEALLDDDGTTFLVDDV